MNIKAKIIGIFALATIFVMSVCGAFLYLSNRTAMSADLSVSAESMAQRLSRSLATPLAEKNKQQAASILGAEMLEKTVSAVIVREADGKKVFTGLQRDAQGAQTEALHAPEGDCIRASMPVPGDRGKLGSVDVYLTRAYLRQALAGAVFKLAVLVLILTTVLSAVLYLSIELLLVRPLNKVVFLARAVARGDVSIAIDVRQKDEVGELADAMTTMTENYSTLVMTSVAIAGGDLTTKVAPLSPQDALGWALKGMVEMLSESIMEIGTAAGNVAAGSSQMNSVSQAMSQDATEQASLLEEISSSMNEIAAQTILNAENASQANKLAGETKMLAERGNERMDRMMSSMKGINDAAKSISRIIKVIDEIAFQTNLLALNAAVEAARAGRHGKGFAVVAEEVRTLAARSAKAARETAELIESAVRTVDGGAGFAASTAEALKEIMSAATKMTDIVAEIAAASNEQAQGVTQINTGLGHVDKVTQQNTAHAEESAAAAQELSSQAVTLQQLVSSFQVCETTAPGPSQA